jgi:hypothetical protein
MLSYFDEMRSMGVKYNANTYIKMLDVFAEQGINSIMSLFLCRNGSNTISGDMDSVLNYLDFMHKDNCPPPAAAWNALLKIYAKQGYGGHIPNPFYQSACMIDVLIDCYRKPDEIGLRFMEMRRAGAPPNLQSYILVMQAYAEKNNYGIVKRIHDNSHINLITLSRKSWVFPWTT